MRLNASISLSLSLSLLSQCGLIVTDRSLVLHLSRNTHESVIKQPIAGCSFTQCKTAVAGAEADCLRIELPAGAGHLILVGFAGSNLSRALQALSHPDIPLDPGPGGKEESEPEPEVMGESLEIRINYF